MVGVNKQKQKSKQKLCFMSLQPKLENKQTKLVQLKTNPNLAFQEQNFLLLLKKNLKICIIFFEKKEK